MSYEIVYGTSFIDLGEGKYLPVILTGSNNCTMFYGNKEIRERYWGLFFGAKGITTKENMLEWARNLLENHTADYEMEWFRKGGKWVVGEQIYKYIENACKNAKTIEDYSKCCSQSIQLSLYGYGKDDMPSKRNENYKACRTTQEILDWFETVDTFDMGDGYSKYVNAEFWGIKPFGIKKQNDKVFENPFLVKVGSQYLVSYEPNCSYTVTKDKTQAMVFTDRKEFATDILPFISSISRKSVIAVSSEIKDKVNPYCIRVITNKYYNGSYVKKLTRNSVRFGNIDDSRRFPSIKQAEKYIADKLKDRFDGCEWEVAMAD